jgi:SPP1 family phage portal protein
MVDKKQKEEVNLTKEDILKLIEEYNVNKYLQLEEYYKSKHLILEKKTGANKPNNILVNNFSKYITDVNLGYFMGKPVTYTTEEQFQEKLDELQNAFDYNDEQSQNAILAKQTSMKGKCYELLYLDEESNLRFNYVYAENMIVAFDDAITPNYIYAIRFSMTADGEGFEFVEVYTDNEIIIYQGEGKDIVETNRFSHPFEDVPVIEYKNNDEETGDFETVISLIDAYNKAQSETADDLEYFADAYLKIKNLSGTKDDDLTDMRKNRTILIDGDGDADFLTKSIDDVAVENYKIRLQEDIHRFSMTPNLTDESFAGNLSGVALEFKLWGLEQLAAQKERMFKKGLQRRIELICNYFKFLNQEFDWRHIKLNFKRNIPMNIEDIVEMTVKLKGIISDRTLLSQLPFIEDVNEELEQIENEANAYAGAMGIMGTETTEEEPDVEETEEDDLTETTEE